MLLVLSAMFGLLAVIFGIIGMCKGEYRGADYLFIGIIIFFISIMLLLQ